jgi:hypothetical protein
MYSLVRLLPWSRLLTEQLPAFGLAFVIAELFYKFHSFTLETIAFLATWAALDALIQAARHLALGSRSAIDTRRT